MCVLSESRIAGSGNLVGRGFFGMVVDNENEECVAVLQSALEFLHVIVVHGKSIDSNSMKLRSVQAAEQAVPCENVILFLSMTMSPR